MTHDVLIDDVSVLDLSHAALAGDRGHFVRVAAEGVSGSYGPISLHTANRASTMAAALIGMPVDAHSAHLDTWIEIFSDNPDKASSWAVGALDCAVWDLHGRLFNQRVADLLAGGDAARAVPAYASWLRLDVWEEGAGAKIREVSQAGWSFSKWGLRASSHDGSPTQIAEALLRQVDAFVEAAGCPVAFDAVRTWDEQIFRAFQDRAEAHKFIWLEDPFERLDAQQMSIGPVPLAFGETFLLDVSPTIAGEVGRAGTLVLDVVGVGGLTNAVRLISQLPPGVSIYPHGRSLIPAIHLAAAHPTVIPSVEFQIQWEPRRQRLYRRKLIPDAGKLEVRGAGLGLEPLDG